MNLSALFRLGRFDKPIGAILLLFPCLWGIALVQGAHIDFILLSLFTLGAFVMRAAGCIINDFFDRDIDQLITRTKDRPLASGEITIRQAFIFLFFLCFIGLFILIQLPPACWFLGIVAAILALIYPLAKRYTPFPQFILGITFNMGVPIGVAAASPQWTESVVWWVYIAAILWTVAYDTIYALQDRLDDQRLQVGSTAILFGQRVIPIVGGCYSTMHLLLIYVLYQLGSGPIGYILLFSSLSYILNKLRKLDSENIEACRYFFITNEIVGALVFLALLFR